MIKQEVEKLLGVSIETFSQTFAELDAKGKLDQKIVYKLLEIILNHLEYPPSPQDAPKTPLTTSEVSLYNPLKENVTVEVRDDKNIKIPYTIHALEIEHFTSEVAKILEKAIAVKLVNEKSKKTNNEDDMKEAIKSTEVKI